MSIGKISFLNISGSQNFCGLNKREKLSKPVSSGDKDKSNAAKYMIGAAALAGAIAVGIIGHKNNWWRKAAKTVKSADNNLKNKNTQEHKTGTPSGPNNGGDNNLNVEEPKPIEIPENPEDYPFNKIEGMRLSPRTIVQFDGEGRLIKEFESYNGKTVSSVIEYGKSGSRLKYTIYRPNEKLLSITDYDPASGNKVKHSVFKDDGVNLNFVEEYDPVSRNKVKYSVFKDDGVNLNFVEEYDPANGNKVKQSVYKDDGVNLDYTIDYDPVSEDKLRTTWYNTDGSVNTVEEINRSMANSII